MKAVDDILVKDIEIAIIANGEVIGQGEVVRNDFNAPLWTYRTQEPNGHESFVVRVKATDIAGNQTIGEVET